jgi:hypothetical protein
MDARVKQLWLNALRSGEYTQAQGVLRSNNGYCCLGVLCDLYIKEHNLAWNYDPVELEYSIGNDLGTLPNSVMNWASVEDSSPTVKLTPYTSPIALAKLNDDLEWNFTQIADVIEREL